MDPRATVMLWFKDPYMLWLVDCSSLFHAHTTWWAGAPSMLQLRVLQPIFGTHLKGFPHHGVSTRAKTVSVDLFTALICNYDFRRDGGGIPHSTIRACNFSEVSKAKKFIQCLRNTLMNPFKPVPIRMLRRTTSFWIIDFVGREMLWNVGWNFQEWYGSRPCKCNLLATQFPFRLRVPILTMAVPQCRHGQ